MHRFPRLVTLICFAPALAPSPAAAQEVKYEKYKLENGMTVILHEDHALPVAAVNIWYRVGSKDERDRRSGFAHLFEHLMFMGTRRVPGGDFDTIMEAGGGANNASTSSDRTNYYSSGPARLLPTLLWLDADRLEDLGREMTKEKLDRQRDVVRNERRQSYENRPYGRVELQIQEMMFPVGHPYHIPVIGTHEDLEAATVNDVKDFFANYYVPNNGTLVVAGDFDPAAVKKQIADQFGTIARGGEPEHRTAAGVKLKGVLRTTMLDKVQLPMVAYAYHSPGKYLEGDAEMDLIGDILTEGKTSRLYKRLVYEDKIAVDVSAYQDASQLGSVFRIDVSTKPDADLDQIDKAVDEEVARLKETGPAADELDRHKATTELGMLARIQSVESKADQLNEYEYYFGEPNSFKRDLDRYRNATADGIKKWANYVLTPDARVIARVLPEAPEIHESPRDEHPKFLTEKPFVPQAPEQFKLSNGIPVMLWRKTELPLVASRLVLYGGTTLNSPDHAGLPALTADMLEEGGAGERNALQFGDAVQQLGAEFGASADHEAFSVSLSVVKRNFDKAVGLMADAVLRPRFDPAEWDRVKTLHLEGLQQMDEEPTIVASRIASRCLFDKDNPYALPAVGTIDTVTPLKVEDLSRQYAAFFRPEFATILIAGDITADQAKAALDAAFGSWKTPSTPPAHQSPLKLLARDKMQVVIVDRPSAVQTVVHFIMPGPTYMDERRVQYRLLNTLFGGSFTSRLNQNLREAHGYTYGARSRFAMEPLAGFFTATSSVRADVTGESVQEFLNEIKRVRAGDITPEEATKARETLKTDVVQSFAGLGGVLSEAAERVAAGLPFETLTKDMLAMQTVEATNLNQLAPGAIPLDRGVLVLVGDKKLILEEIAGLDLPPAVELTVRGEPVKPPNTK